MKNLIPTLLVIVITIISCNPSEPENNQEITLKVEDVSCIEAWLNIQTNNISLPAQINLTANSSLINQFTLTTSDSIIIIDSLYPSTSYLFQAAIDDNIISNSVNAVTMDTTSHNFVWETFNFGGDGGSSYLKDVAIINENNIWAVGEIYENGEKYNAVQWNGIDWKLRKMTNSIYISGINTIYAFKENDIWFDGVIHWDGNKLTVDLDNFPYEPNGDVWLINGMWGTSSNNFYVVGNNGNIAYYNGNNWRKIESGTELDIYDIWGDYNEATEEYEILAVAAKLLQSSDRDIIKISGNQATILSDKEITQPLRSVWFKSSRLYIVGGSGRYTKSDLQDKLWSKQWSVITNYFSNKIRGNNINNIFISGSFGEVLHYNGFTWYSYLNKELSQFYGELYSISVNGATVCIVGQDQWLCKIYMGKNGGNP